jgi:glycosyltransferase involved in cell wall biosynthesis
VLVPGVPVPTDLPLVATVHDLTPIMFPRFFDRQTGWLYGRTVRQIARQARRIIAVSEQTRQDLCTLLEVPAERVAVVHLGVPQDIRRPTPSQLGATLERYGLAEVPYVLFVGVLTDRKNPLGLVEAFSLVAARWPDARLVLVGSEGLGGEAVGRRIQALGLDRQARVLGHVARCDLPALLTGAAVFVLPSVYEGFGIPVLEAMACGAPVIVSDGGSLPELVGDAGLVVPRAEPDGLADSILEVLGDPPTRERLSRLALSRARQFSWERAAEQTLAVYEDALRA